MQPIHPCSCTKVAGNGVFDQSSLHIDRKKITLPHPSRDSSRPTRRIIRMGSGRHVEYFENGKPSQGRKKVLAAVLPLKPSASRFSHWLLAGVFRGVGRGRQVVASIGRLKVQHLIANQTARSAGGLFT